MDDLSQPTRCKPKYKRVVLKLSGEGFGTAGKSGISIDETLNIARQAKRVVQRGVQLAIVVGGGNILRGAQFSAGGEVIKEATAHYMGMLATVLNGLALQDALESLQLRDPPADRHPHGERGRAVHPPPLHPPPGEGAHRHPGRRHRQPVRHHRHRRRPARPRAGGRHPAQGDARWTASTATIPR